MKHLHPLWWLIIPVLLSACFHDSSDAASGNTIKLGVVTARFGNPISLPGQAATLAMEEINAAGGINGTPIELIIKDSACSSTITPGEVASLAASDAIVALVGPSCSSVGTVLIQDVLPVYNLPAVAITTTSPTLTTLDEDDLYYRLRLSDQVQTVSLLNELIADGVTRLGIIHRGGNDSFNIALAEGLAAQFSALDNKQTVVVVDYPEAALVEFSSEVDELFDAGTIDGIAIFGFATDSANVASSIAAELTERAINLSDILGVYTNNLTRLDESLQISSALALLNGSKSVSSDALSNATAPNYAPWLTDFLQAFPGSEGQPEAYDAVYLISLAMLQGQVDGTNTVAQIRSTIKTNLRGVSGTNAAVDAVTINPGDFATAASTITAGGTVNYNGASGIIDFDEFGDVNYGDLSVIEASIVADKLEFNCLHLVRVFTQDNAIATEQNVCEP